MALPIINANLVWDNCNISSQASSSSFLSPIESKVKSIAGKLKTLRVKRGREEENQEAPIDKKPKIPPNCLPLTPLDWEKKIVRLIKNQGSYTDFMTLIFHYNFTLKS